uniref:Uncharacterized protein n=1 Tax=Anguilla anguilla TaxID=7936 RepID=A0A0E9U2N8_ANGAN
MSIKKITIQNCFPSGPKHSVKNTFGEQYSLKRTHQAAMENKLGTCAGHIM